MLSDKKGGRSLWMLALSMAICIGYMVADAAGVGFPPVVNGVLLIVAMVLMLCYIIRNYGKRE